MPLSVEMQDTLLHAAGSMQWLGRSKRQTDFALVPCSFSQKKVILIVSLQGIQKGDEEAVFAFS